jgi:CelD/BcsL family acetyltransferase involved in cellulose biosynthesis
LRTVNFFSSDEYLGALAETWFPGRSWNVGVYAAEGRLFRLLSVHGRGPIVTDGLGRGSYHFLDFFEPLAGAPLAATSVPRVRWLPRVALDVHDVASALPAAAPMAEARAPAPYVDWSRFPDWKAFQAHVTSRRSSLARDSRRKRRKLERCFGPLRFEWDDRDPKAFGTALAWKSAQYVRTKVRDGFAIPQNVRLFQELWRRGLLVASSLTAGERRVAVHLGVLWERRFYSWIPAYDPALSADSPGRILLEYLLAESHARGHAQFDFLLGGEAYKYHYATHCRVIGPLGTAPLPESLRRGARAAVKRALSVYPPLLDRARALEHRWTSGAGDRERAR